MAKARGGSEMKVVVLAASKGGSGKSTIASVLAVRAADEADVAMLDIDAQRSLASWWERRGKPDNPELIDVRGGLAATLMNLRKRGFDWCFIDTPPSRLQSIEEAVTQGDLILIVVQASAFDVEAIAPVVEMAQRSGKSFAFVLNRVEAKWKLTEATIRYLKDDGRVLKEQLSNRPSYMAAVLAGKTGAESDDKTARDEVDALWRAVKRLAASSVKSR